jgi:hypothetical protein
MNRRTLLHLYPHRWRQRYGDEFLALLEQQRMTPAVITDVLLGALDAHLRAHVSPVAGTATEQMTQCLLALRTTTLTVFCAYITFVVAGLAFFGMVDDSPFVTAMRDHVALNACWLAIETGAAISLLAVIAGGLPIGVAALGYALSHKRRDILCLLCVPAIALGVVMLGFALLAAMFVGWFSAPLPGALSAVAHPRIGNTALVVTNGVLFVAAAIASTAAVAVAVTRSEIGTQRVRALGIRMTIQPYRFALLPAAMTAMAMGFTLITTLSWGIVARSVAPRAFTPGILLAWLTIVAAMALATLIASIGVIRGYAASTPPIVARQ